MNILDAIVNAQDGAAVQQLGSQVGLGSRPDDSGALCAGAGAGRRISAKHPEPGRPGEPDVRAVVRATTGNTSTTRTSLGDHVGGDRWQRHPRPPVGQQGRQPRGRQSRGGANRTERRCAQTDAAAGRDADDGRVLEAVGPGVLDRRGTRWLRRRHRGDAGAAARSESRRLDHGRCDVDDRPLHEAVV